MMDNKTRIVKSKLDNTAYCLIVLISIILIISYFFGLLWINSSFSDKNKFPILSAIFTACTITLLNLPEPLYYFIVKAFKKINLNLYKDEYHSQVMFLKATGIFMSILSTVIYCVILSK